MNKSRLEAFSDGVLAIIITIMVLEIKVPHQSEWAAFKEQLPIIISYVISFLMVGIYWGNHHHLLHAAKKVTTPILMTNLNLLFWLSLVPVASGWMGETHFSVNSIILYAILLLVCGVADGLLQAQILKTLNPDSALVIALKSQNLKMFISLTSAIAAIPLAYLSPVLSGICFVIVSGAWLLPDKKIEKALSEENN